jgi:hypothetical protein
MLRQLVRGRAFSALAGMGLFACSMDGDRHAAENLERAEQALAQPSAFWKLDDCVNPPGTLAEGTGTSVPATAVGGSCVASDHGKAIAFNAEGQRLEMPAHSSLAFGKNFAIAAWIQPSQVSFNSVHTIARQNISGSSAPAFAFQIAQGTLELQLNVASGGPGGLNIRGAAFGRQIPTNVPTHVAATWDGTNLRLFINGTQVSLTTFSVPGGAALVGSGGSMKVGGSAQVTQPSQQFLGTIDELWLSSNPTTAADVQEVMAGFGPTCNIDPERELMITDLGVVEDPARTTNGGAWTFRHLMEAMAPSAAQAPALAESLFSSWLVDQTVGGFTAAARTGVQSLVLDPWPRINGQLDLDQAPLRLLAIVNRIDLRDLSQGKAGEGRFVFGVVDANAGNSPTSFTVILEYRLPATSEADVLAWADRWHDLGALALGSAAYNQALEGVTELFAGRNAEPGRVNGSALSQLRTNEIALSFPWELREFTLSPTTGLFRTDTVKLTPDNSLMGSATLASFINQNEATILTQTHDVPSTFNGAPFLGTAVRNNIDFWDAPGINNPEARHLFSLNTCNGCHGREAGINDFLQIHPRSAGSEAALSGFLTGTVVSDPVSAQERPFNDLQRRADDLSGLACAPPAGASASFAAAPAPVSISKGISRVH